MKWFKHMSDSLDDPFVFELTSLFGGDGYLVFFGIIELYSREFKTELNWNLSVTRSYLRTKMNKRQDTLIIKILKHIQNSGKWFIEFNGEQVIVFIPNFTEIMDEWAKRKLGSNSGATPKILSPEEEVDKEYRLKKEIIKKEIEALQKSGEKKLYHEYVLLTEFEYDALCKEFWQEITDEMILKLNDYIGMTLKHYASHFHTIRIWIRQEIMKGRRKPDDTDTANKREYTTTSR